MSRQTQYEQAVKGTITRLTRLALTLEEQRHALRQTAARKTSDRAAAFESMFLGYIDSLEAVNAHVLEIERELGLESEPEPICAGHWATLSHGAAATVTIPGCNCKNEEVAR